MLDIKALCFDAGLFSFADVVPAQSGNPELSDEIRFTLHDIRGSAGGLTVLDIEALCDPQGFFIEY